MMSEEKNDGEDWAASAGSGSREYVRGAPEDPTKAGSCRGTEPCPYAADACPNHSPDQQAADELARRCSADAIPVGATVKCICWPGCQGRCSASATPCESCGAKGVPVHEDRTVPRVFCDDESACERRRSASAPSDVESRLRTEVESLKVQLDITKQIATEKADALAKEKKR